MSKNVSQIKRRKLPKLYSCITKSSLENLRNRALFSMDVLGAKGIRRMNYDLHECLVLELQEGGYSESSAYLQDLIYDNVQLVNEDDLGVVTDLRKRDDYLEHICDCLQLAEKEHDKGNLKKETLYMLDLAMYYAEREKGILWLAEKFFLASIAVSSQYLVDGGRQKTCCKYHYAKFLLDKFPGIDDDEPYNILTEVRDASIGKNWTLQEEDDTSDAPRITVFSASALQLYRVLINSARKYRSIDAPKAERLARLAERRAKDAEETAKEAAAIIEIGVSQLLMNNLNNSQKTFERALKIYQSIEDVEGICETKMHFSAVMQRLGDHEMASKLLTEMGVMAMQHGLRRQLGRALHLLGELHLRRERPELGTQHLSEAFMCFMGFQFNAMISETTAKAREKKEKGKDISREESKPLSQLYTKGNKEIFEEEAEQSRLMTAISAGQELMASYFGLLNEAGVCAVAKLKVIEWKLSHQGWWVQRRHHDYMPCLCPVHNRSPLDVMRMQLNAAKEKIEFQSASSGHVDVARTDTTEDIRKLRSSFIDGFLK